MSAPPGHYGAALRQYAAQGLSGPALEIVAALEAEMMDVLSEMLADPRPLRYDASGKIRIEEAVRKLPPCP